MPVVTLNFTHARARIGEIYWEFMWEMRLYSRSSSGGALTQRAFGTHWAETQGNVTTYNVTASVAAFTPPNPIWLAARFKVSDAEDAYDSAETAIVNEDVGSRALSAVNACTITAQADESYEAPNIYLEWKANRSITGLDVTEESGGTVYEQDASVSSSAITNLSRRVLKRLSVSSQAVTSLSRRTFKRLGVSSQAVVSLTHQLVQALLAPADVHSNLETYGTKTIWEYEGEGQTGFLVERKVDDGEWVRVHGD